MAKIGVLEDDSLMRVAMSESLRALGHEVVFASGQAGAFLKKLGQRHIEVALLDVHLGVGITGIDVSHKIRAIYPRVAIIFLTSLSDPRLIGPTNTKLPEGSFYLDKGKIETIESIGQVIDDALSGDGDINKPFPGELGNLTDTQLSVLRMVANGLSNTEIAKQQGTTVKNVEALISRIIKSLGLKGVENNNQRVHMARVYFRYRGVNLDD